MKYIFDVDGTLTPSRGTIDVNFSWWFAKFAEANEVYLVTGSDREKTLEQVGQTIYSLCKRVYQCAGNDVWEGDQNVYTNTVEVDPDMQKMFEQYLQESKFGARTGRHIEVRPGLINFSIVGRNATLGERKMYVAWDDVTSERREIADNLNAMFDDFDVTVAGETGIDIVPKGKDKSQILKDFDNYKELHFFGDKMEPGGNDYTLGAKLAYSGGKITQVKDWKDTWQSLKSL